MWSVSGEASVSALQVAALLLCSHKPSSLSILGERKRTSSLVSLLRRTLILSYQGPTLMASFNLLISLYVLYPNMVILGI